MSLDEMVNKSIEMLRERGTEEDSAKADFYEGRWNLGDPAGYGRAVAGFHAMGFLLGAGVITQEEQDAALKELGGW